MVTQTVTATLVITMADTSTSAIIRLVNFHTLRVSVVLNGVPSLASLTPV